MSNPTNEGLPTDYELRYCSREKDLGLRAELARLKAEREEMLAALSGLLQALGQECHFDHHGYCQAHFVESPCRVAFSRAIVAKAGKGAA